MRLLLDTHVFLWAVTDDPKLSLASREVIQLADEVYVSAASIWEISIKAGLGKIDADPAALTAEIRAAGFLELPITAAHAAKVCTLPDIHRDPFDRLLVAQAMCEPLQLFTADANVLKYTDLAWRV